MDEDYNMTYGIDKLAELLAERGIEFYVKDEMSLLFVDNSGNPHECWMAGAEENLVNVMIVITPKQAISVPDLNGVITENAKLRNFIYDMWNDMNVYYTQHESPDSSDIDFYRDSMRELGMEVSTRRYSDD